MSMQPVLQDRTVLITGAAGGLGSAAAVACAQAGATVILLGRKVAALNRVYDAVKAEGPEPILYPLDLEGAAPDDYDQLAQAIDGEFGKLDGLLHCAAEFKGLTPLAHTDPADFARAVHVDLTARWWLTQACLPLLAKSDAAAVVCAFWGGYGIAQAGQAAMIAMLQAELGEHGPRISGYCPGPMRTQLRGKAYQANNDLNARAAADYAQACVTLLSSEAAGWRGKIQYAGPESSA